MAETQTPGRYDESCVLVVARPYNGCATGTWSTSGVFLNREAAQAHAEALNEHLRVQYPDFAQYEVRTLDDLLSDVYSDGQQDGAHPYEG